MLLQHKPGPAALNQALYSAAGDKHIENLRTLLDAGADVNAGRPNSGVTALARAGGAANEEQVRLLLSRGADANRASDIGMAPLLLAVSEFSTGSGEQDVARRLRIVDLLLD